LFFHFLFQINRKNGETLIDFLGVYTFLGVAICTKLTGVILFVPFFVFLFYEFTKKKWSVLKKFLLMFPVFITVVYILSPGLVTGVTTHLTGIEKLYLKREEIVQPVERLTGFTRLPPLLFYAKELYINSGLPLFIFFISGVFFTLFNCKLTDFLLLSFVVPYSVILLVPKGADVVFSRYLLPMIVILALFTSRFFSEIFKKIKQKPGSLIFLICVATGIFILPVKNIVIQDYVFSQNDTRNLLREWLYENLKSGDKVLVDFQKLSYPGQDPGFSWQLQKTGFNFVTISNFSEWSEIKKFRKSGIKFVVLRPDIYSDVLLENFPDKTKAQNMKTFYQFIKSANDNFTAIAGFGFGKKLISGPRLEVFKFSDS
jgi:hypothetical protein